MTRGCTGCACRRRTRCFSEIETFPFFGPNILLRRWLEAISKGKLCECSPSNSCLQCSSPLQGRKPGQEDFEVGFIHWWFYIFVVSCLCGFISLGFSIFVVLDCIDNTSNGDKITSDVKGAHPRIMIVWPAAARKDKSTETMMTAAKTIMLVMAAIRTSATTSTIIL